MLFYLEISENRLSFLTQCLSLVSAFSQVEYVFTNRALTQVRMVSRNHNRSNPSRRNVIAATQMHSSLLTISVGALLLPVVYHFATGGSSGEVDTTEKTHILDMSHGVSRFDAIYVINCLMLLTRCP